MCHDRIMERVWTAGKGMLMLAVTLHMRHRFHGPAIDYIGLAAAAGASWAGVPGPGEPVLIAEAIFAARHSLDISSVVLVAWLGASAGGLVGWTIGIKAGRAIVTARGPLRAMRQRAVGRGEEVFARHPVAAVLLTPAWVAGILRVGPKIYVPLNELGAAVWAAGIGLGAYFVGPPVVDLVDDAGTILTVVLALLVLSTVGAEVMRRRRQRARRPAG